MKSTREEKSPWEEKKLVWRKKAPGSKEKLLAESLLFLAYFLVDIHFDVNLIVAAVLGKGVHEEGEQLEDGVEGGQADEDVHKACLWFANIWFWWAVLWKNLQVNLTTGKDGDGDNVACGGFF